MKKIIFALVMVSLTGQAYALDRADLDQRIQQLTTKFDELQANPDKRVPMDVLAKAQGIILLDRFKAGFIVAYEGGHGVAMVKGPQGNWSPAAFLSANQGSFGAQAGGEDHFDVILLMTTNGTRTLTQSSFNLGALAQVTAGDDSASTQSNLKSPGREVLVYDSRDGLYGGVAVKFGTLDPDKHANEVYYGPDTTMSDILFANQIKPTPADTSLAQNIAQYAHPNNNNEQPRAGRP